MNKFRVGDKVVALNTRQCKYNPREEGKEYTVFGVMQCPNCRTELISIRSSMLAATKQIKCSDCGCTDMHSNHYWTKASNFRSKDNFDLHDELKIAIINENYERAAQLRDIIKRQEETIEKM